MQFKTAMNITSYQSEWPPFRSPQMTNAEEDVEKRENSSSVGRNVNWCNHYAKQYGDSSKNYK